MVSVKSSEIIEKYEQVLRRDPHSRVFAALADAYREAGRYKDAEELAKRGIERHPQYVGGYVALGRLLVSQKKHEEALPFLTQAVQLAPENLLAYQLLGQSLIELKRLDEALRAFKMALFLNPLSESSRRAVEKLESLSAEEFEEEVFQMKPLPQAVEKLSMTQVGQHPLHVQEAKAESSLHKKKERTLSWIDALIVRNEIAKARSQAHELLSQFPGDPEVKKRWDLLSDEEEEATPLRPELSRERAALNRQIEALQKVLRRLDQIRQAVDVTT